MKKWETLTDSDIIIKMKVDNEPVDVSLLDFHDYFITNAGKDLVLIGVTNKYNQKLPEDLEMLLASDIANTEFYHLWNLLYDFVRLDYLSSMVVDNPQALFVEYLGITHKDYVEAYEYFDNNVGYEFAHTNNKLETKKDIIDLHLKLFDKQGLLQDAPEFEYNYLKIDAIKADILDSIKSNNYNDEDEEPLTEEQLDNMVELYIVDMKQNNISVLLEYIDYDEFYKHLEDYYTIIVDENGTSLIDNFYV